MAILEGIKTAVQFILDCGTTVMLPVMVLILGIIFRMKVADALKAGILIGVGFVGINLMVDLMVGGYAPITEYYSSVGADYTVTNIGWSGVAAMAWSCNFALFIVPLGFIVNFILVRLKFTRTLNVDIWNYYCYILTAATGYYMFLNLGVNVTISTIIAVIIGVACSVWSCKIGDRIAPKWQEYFDMPEGVTCTTFDTLLTHYPVSFVGAWIYDHIPGLKKININAAKLSSGKLQSWGSIPVVSFIISLFLLIITKNQASVVLSSAMTITASVILMPKCVSLLMEGLVPISNSARKWMSSKLKDSGDLLIGMDVSIGLGDPCGMTTTMFLLPISVALAYILPGVNFMPVGLFGGMIWTGHAAAYQAKGNLLKSLFAGTFYLCWSLLTLSWMAGVCTQLAFDAGVVTDMATMVTGSGMNQVPVVFIGLIGKILGAF